MYDIRSHHFPALAFLWPALAAESASEIAAAMAKEFINLAVGPQSEPEVREPTWASENRIALELASVRLRDFSTAGGGFPTLICAPFALHGATVADFASGHSLVEALQKCGLQRVFVTDWRSASPEMRLLAIDNYLADLNVVVDEIGGRIDLIGLCQGGWLALMYAARFAAKVRKLVIVGSPIDMAAAESPLSRLVQDTPMPLFHELVALGDGRVLGHRVLQFWAPDVIDPDMVRGVLQPAEEIGPAALRDLEARFRDWYAWTVDLPGTYYLQAVEQLFKNNELARGRFIALGRRLDLADVNMPVYLLAARDDELVASEQLFALERLIATPPAAVHKDTAPCSHLGLFMGRATLCERWPQIAHWLGVAEPALQ